jgi:AraC family transcriptional regulator, regulatory protein of adaptative response / DNA-3-methyladenine glycosylase II
MNPQTLDPQSCYGAMLARDRRFDGKFYVAVSSTGIYCRPVCTVKAPRLSNCSFFYLAAQAESKGYRPCLRCRPEMAPGALGGLAASVDAVKELAARAATMMEAGLADDTSLVHLAQRLQVTDRHLRRVFEREFGVSPVQWAQTRRLLNAKRLLTDTTFSITDVAYASGFASLRRFNALFLERYRMNPARFRKQLGSGGIDSPLSFQLQYRPPYAWAQMLDFLRQRSLPGVDWVEDEVYRRVLDEGWIEVTHLPERCALGLRVAPILASKVVSVIHLVRKVFDLDAEPTRIEAALGAGVHGLEKLTPGLRLPGAFSGFECAIRAVLGQQVTVKAATTLSRRLLEVAGARFALAVTTPWPQLSRRFPSPQEMVQLTIDDIASQGIVSRRAQAILSLAQLCIDQPQLFGPEHQVALVIARLVQIPGFGEWTAGYVALRGMQWPDSFLAKDVVVLKALDLYPQLTVLRAARVAQTVAADWAPWRSYAVLQLWHGAKLTQALSEKVSS